MLQIKFAWEAGDRPSEVRGDADIVRDGTRPHRLAHGRQVRQRSAPPSPWDVMHSQNWAGNKATAPYFSLAGAAAPGLPAESSRRCPRGPGPGRHREREPTPHSPPRHLLLAAA
jgi:hypothetical protein